MSVSKRFYLTVSRLVPGWYKGRAAMLLHYLDVRIDPDAWLGFTLLYSLFAALAISLLASNFVALEGIQAILLFLAFFASANALFYFALEFLVDQRARNIEAVLPDALQLMAANIRAAMTPDKALWVSARPEFGEFTKEINKMGEKAISGMSFKDAMREMGERVRSTTLRRVIQMISEGIDSGGELAGLLEGVANDIRMAGIMEKEVHSNVSAYVVFMMMAVLFAGPLLYAVSLNFVGITIDIRQTVESYQIGAMTPIPTITKVPPIDLSALKAFALLNIAMAAFFGSLMVGVLKEGEEVRGLRFMPGFVLAALAIYTVSFMAIGGLMRMLFVL